MPGCRSCSGRLFHSVGPAVTKQRSPNWLCDLLTKRDRHEDNAQTTPASHRWREIITTIIIIIRRQLSCISTWRHPLWRSFSALIRRPAPYCAAYRILHNWTMHCWVLIFRSVFYRSFPMVEAYRSVERTTANSERT